MRNQETETPSAVPVVSLAVSPARGVTRAVVLVLPGGKAMSRDVTATRQASVLRMLPFSWRIRRRTRRQGVAVWRLRYRYRGWNGAEASPVTDARWALDEVRRRHGPVPVVLLGHSMGGRVAAHVAGDPLVSGLVLLAPWLPSHEPFRVRAGVPVCVLHGDQDRITSAAASTAWAERARRAGADVSVFVIPGGEHFMLRHLLTCHRLATDEVLRGLRAAFLREQPQAAGRGRA